MERTIDVIVCDMMKVRVTYDVCVKVRGCRGGCSVYDVRT